KAVYRLSTPIDLWTTISEDQTQQGQKPVPQIVSGFLSPLQAQITGVAIEYSLHGTHWLPRMRSMEGSAQVLFAHVPMQIDQRFEYRSVNGPDTLSAIDSARLPPVTVRRVNNDSTRRADSVRNADRARRADSVRRTTVGPLSIGVRTGSDSARRARLD